MSFVMIEESILKSTLPEKPWECILSSVHVSINSQNHFKALLVLGGDEMGWSIQEFLCGVYFLFCEEPFVLVPHCVANTRLSHSTQVEINIMSPLDVCPTCCQDHQPRPMGSLPSSVM